DVDAAQRVAVVHVVRVFVFPAVEKRDGLDVLGHQAGAQVGGIGGIEVGEVDVARGCRAGGGGACLVGQPGEHGGAQVADVGLGALLLRLLQRVEEVGNQQRGDDADDRDHDQQLDQ